MMKPRIAVITFELSLPGTGSLKDKRSRLRPVIEGIRKTFHISIAEIGKNQIYDQAVISAGIVGTDVRVMEKVLASVASAVERYDIRIDDIATEIL